VCYVCTVDDAKANNIGLGDACDVHSYFWINASHSVFNSLSVSSTLTTAIKEYVTSFSSIYEKLNRISFVLDVCSANKIFKINFSEHI